MVGYNRRHVEKNLLLKLNIRCFNLEALGCPKYDIIPQDNLLPSCGFHARDIVHHRLITECHAFWDWHKLFLAKHAKE